MDWSNDCFWIKTERQNYLKKCIFLGKPVIGETFQGSFYFNGLGTQIESGKGCTI